MQALDSGFEFEAVGGHRLTAAGVSIIADSTRWGAIGLLQSLKVVPRLYASYYRVKNHLRRGERGLFIAIDFGFMNVKLARHAKGLGWKVLYFIPPGSWRRDRQGRDLPAITDAIVTPFDYSAEILNRNGANAHWFGHPIRQLIDENSVAQSRNDRIAVMPGSRDAELTEHLPLIAAAVDAPIEFALAPTVDLAAFKARWERLALNRRDDVFTVGDVYGVLRRSKAAVVCSGTATLEAALCRAPMVVIYKVSHAVLVETKILRFKRPRFYSLPNILLQREAVPEFIQETALPDLIRAGLESAIANPDPQLAAFDELETLLGPTDAITKTAAFAVDMAKN